MKYLMIAGLAALTLAGAAAAQVIQGTERGIVPQGSFGADPVQPLGSHWTNPQLWDGYDDPNRPTGNEFPALPSGLDTRMRSQVTSGLKVAVPQMRMACAADRQSLCADKATNLAADRCLEYHRLRLSKPCHQAWDKLTLAAEGRL
jgi:hypothetical protein